MSQRRENADDLEMDPLPTDSTGRAWKAGSMWLRSRSGNPGGGGGRQKLDCKPTSESLWVLLSLPPANATGQDAGPSSTGPQADPLARRLKPGGGNQLGGKEKVTCRTGFPSASVTGTDYGHRFASVVRPCNVRRMTTPPNARGDRTARRTSLGCPARQETLIKDRRARSLQHKSRRPCSPSGSIP